MISVTTPLGFTRAFTWSVTPVFSEEMLLRSTTPPPEGIVVVPVVTGTWYPTLIDAGMLSVAIRLGSESMWTWRVFSFRVSVASSSRPLSTSVPTVKRPEPGAIEHAVGLRWVAADLLQSVGDSAGELVGEIHFVNLRFEQNLARRNIQFLEDLQNALILLRVGLNDAARCPADWGQCAAA